MNEQEMRDNNLNDFEKEIPIGSSLDDNASGDSGRGRTIPISDQDAIERAESFSDELESAASATALMNEEELDSATLQLRVAELEDRLVRSLADYDNLRKRSARQLDEMSKQATDGLILELLEVLDNVERAEEAVPANTAQSPEINQILKGIGMIHQQLSTILTRRQIEAFSSVDQPFDSKLHEALMQIPDENRPSGVIAMEIARGYKQGERVIRHAKVGVSSGRGKG